MHDIPTLLLLGMDTCGVQTADHAAWVLGAAENMYGSRWVIYKIVANTSAVSRTD